MKKSCEVTTCHNPQAAGGLCWKHYARKRRHGSALSTTRNYRTGPHCRFCGTSDVEKFYPRYKGICRTCRKLKSIRLCPA
jgi:hypothetical protein